MNITPDYLIERKRSKMQIAKWKIFALLLIIALLAMLTNRWSSGDISQGSFVASKDHIASIRVNDIIFDDLNRVRKISAISKNDAIKAVIVHINSQGGSVVGSEMLYNSLLKLSKEKPVVVVMESVAASGGYLASLGADYIIAHNGTITGSIGVIMQSAEITDFADKVGITFNNFKSDALKASPNLFEKLTPEAKQATMDSIYEVYDYFIELVAIRRNLDLDYVKKLADGRIYSGRQALDLKLVDAIGDEDSAIEWLRAQKGISPDLEVLDVRLSPKDKFLDILMEDFKTSISSVFASSFKGLKSII
ncbi:MAG: signal peptide peptidase SppA [Rickettsiaceae bacterium]|nr:signal peptide peptidase SppA [Rickettsiaceae bacterium]MDP4832118.1 signal peptide peptidase SppA [Rickettsiaceae bacterium]MDP5020314.1 signal peptide peptidase SppA [Rickettsiaceae bacterium]MDP5082634.1 signal peptide peptidase SppA [Rickettsiaceae bacterium]